MMSERGLSLAHATTGAPQGVSIEFDEALESAFSSIVLADGKSTVGATDEKLTKVAPTELALGKYTVTWATTVANDGYRARGHYSFTVKY
jgi:methionine-rich copper-binding protein CopC